MNVRPGFHRAAWPACAAAVAVHAAAGWFVLGGAAPGGAAPAQAPAMSVRTLAAAAPQASPVPPAPAVPSAGRPHATRRAAAIDGFEPSTALERSAVPRSAPDTSLLEGLPFSGLPIRLRVFVDRSGTVVDVRVLQTAEAEAVAESVRRMFLATAFIPGRLRGQDVGSWQDVEIAFGSTSIGMR